MAKKKQVIKREAKIDFRVTNKEKSIIIGKASTAGLSVGAYVRNTALDYKIVPVFSKFEEEYFFLLKKKYNDFARLKNHYSVQEETKLQLEEIMKEIRELLLMLEI